MRSFAQRRGHDGLAPYLDLLAGDAAARDEFLDRVTINVSNLWRNPEQWERLQAEIVPALAADGTLRAWSAGCSYGAEAYTLAAVCRLAAPPPSPRSSAPTSTAARSSAPAPATSAPRTSATPRPPPSARFFVADGERWRPGAELRALVSFELGDLLRAAPAGERLRPRPLPQHRHLLQRGGPRRAPRAPRLRPAPRRRPRRRRHRARDRARGDRTCRPWPPSPTARPERWTRASTSRCSSPSAASTCRSSTSPSCASRSSPTTARRSTRSSASPTR